MISISKLIFYYIFSVLTETANTFTGVAKSGYMSTITPNPNERVHLITLAELLTGYMGEDVTDKCTVEWRDEYRNVLDAPFTVTLAVTVYDFGSLADDAAAKESKDEKGASK